MLETELKAMLTKAQYEALELDFQWNSVKEQTNSYYIAPDNLLKKHGITFRVRTINGLNTVQVKKHQPKQGALQIAEETEFIIDSIPQTFSEDETEKYTGIRTVVSYIGNLITKRNSCMYCDGVEICLDKSTYLETTDYEIEIDREVISIFCDFIESCQDENINTYLVYSPEYIEGQHYVKNRAEMMNILREDAAKKLGL